MSESQAKKYLAKMMVTLTGGSVLHLLADIFRESAEEARLSDEPIAYQQCKQIENTLVTVGYGIDATLPQ